MEHTHYCRTLDHSDAAKRIYETYTLHRLADPIGNLGQWFAVAIADGSTDGVLYDSRIDAITHQHHNETYYVYVLIGPHQMSLCDAEIFLAGVRKTYDARKAMMDRDRPSGGKVIIPRLTVEDQLAQNAGKWQNLILPEGFTK
jgi:hypothetical protein